MKNHFTMKQQPAIDTFLQSLPYELTAAQMRVWNEIQKEMTGDYVMSRLVQGDVGSGKTIVAFFRTPAFRTQRLSGCINGSDRSACPAAL